MSTKSFQQTALIALLGIAFVAAALTSPTLSYASTNDSSTNTTTASTQSQKQPRNQNQSQGQSGEQPQAPEGFDPSNMPEDFDPSNMPQGGMMGRGGINPLLLAGGIGLITFTIGFAGGFFLAKGLEKRKSTKIMPIEVVASQVSNAPVPATETSAPTEE